MHNIIKPLRRLCDNHANAVSVTTACVVLVADDATGRHIQFPILYTIPAGLAVWKQLKRSAVYIHFAAHGPRLVSLPVA